MTTGEAIKVIIWAFVALGLLITSVVFAFNGSPLAAIYSALLWIGVTNNLNSSIIARKLN